MKRAAKINKNDNVTNVKRQVPIGIEILVKKAAVDPQFKRWLVAKRSAAAGEIGLRLDPSEATMLDAIPEAQLNMIIRNTKVSPKIKPAFLGYAAGAMIAALGIGITGCSSEAIDDMNSKSEETVKYEPVETGNRPDLPEDTEQYASAYIESPGLPESGGYGTGIRSDMPDGVDEE